MDVERVVVMYGFFCALHLTFMFKITQVIICSILVFSCHNNFLTTEAKPTKFLSKAIEANFICNYHEFKSQAQKHLKAYQANPDSITRQTLIFFIRDSMVTCWLGTSWDFYGTSEEPGKGKIACGYFVTTLLRDIGVKVNRIKHAQCASEEMIKAVCQKSSLQRFRNVMLAEFVANIKNKGQGLYITGLDYHTGFILNDGENVFFIHSTYAGEKKVIKESAIKSGVLSASDYKVIGKVF